MFGLFQKHTQDDLFLALLRWENDLTSNECLRLLGLGRMHFWKGKNMEWPRFWEWWPRFCGWWPRNPMCKWRPRFREWWPRKSICKWWPKFWGKGLEIQVLNSGLGLEGGGLEIQFWIGGLCFHGLEIQLVIFGLDFGGGGLEIHF